MDQVIYFGYSRNKILHCNGFRSFRNKSFKILKKLTCLEKLMNSFLLIFLNKRLINITHLCLKAFGSSCTRHQYVVSTFGTLTRSFASCNFHVSMGYSGFSCGVNLSNSILVIPDVVASLVTRPANE